MLFLVGVYDLFAFTAISRRWLSWAMVAAMASGIAPLLAEIGWLAAS